MNLSTIRTMAALSPRSHSHNSYRTRCVSFPARSHPSTIKIEQVLNKIKTWESSSPLSPKAEEKTQNALSSGLVELYECIEELLALPMTQRALLQHQDDNFVKELLERSVRFIDICSNTRDTVMCLKESVRELQSALRRSKAGDDLLTIEGSVSAYISSRKNAQKEIEKSLTILKQIHNTPSATMKDSQLSAIIRVLEDASFTTISTFQSLLMFLYVPASKPKSNKWSLVSKLVHKGVVGSEGQREKLTELEKVDTALNSLLDHVSGHEEEVESFEFAQKNLENLESSIEDLENGLEMLFKLLIRTRVSLLNILSLSR